MLIVVIGASWLAEYRSTGGFMQEPMEFVLFAVDFCRTTFAKYLQANIAVKKLPTTDTMSIRDNCWSHIEKQEYQSEGTKEAITPKKRGEAMVTSTAATYPRNMAMRCRRLIRTLLYLYLFFPGDGRSYGRSAPCDLLIARGAYVLETIAFGQNDLSRDRMSSRSWSYDPD